MHMHIQKYRSMEVQKSLVFYSFLRFLNLGAQAQAISSCVVHQLSRRMGLCAPYAFPRRPAFRKSCQQRLLRRENFPSHFHHGLIHPQACKVPRIKFSMFQIPADIYSRHIQIMIIIITIIIIITTIIILILILILILIVIPFLPFFRLKSGRSGEILGIPERWVWKGTRAFLLFQLRGG